MFRNGNTVSHTQKGKEKKRVSILVRFDNKCNKLRIQSSKERIREPPGEKKQNITPQKKFFLYN